MINGILFRRNAHDFLRKYLERNDVHIVLKDKHDGRTGGNIFKVETINKILRVGYYWPTLLKDDD